ncbi:MAG: APC family permease, partial [Bacteroidota bacterium]
HPNPSLAGGAHKPMNHTAQRQPAQTQAHELRRELSLLDSTMINVGSMIGSGIFLVPATIALYLHHSSSIILVWIFGGVVSLFGALSVAELGAMYPSAGGQYVYLREAFGPLWGFLYGWTAFTVILPAAIAAVAVAFATYLGYFFPFTPTDIKIIAIASIILLTAINCYGVKAGAMVQNGFTFLKMGSLGALIIAGFIVKGALPAERVALAQPVDFYSLINGVGLALVAVLWSYDGWIEITYVAGEVKNPQRTIPRSLILSTIIVILIYVLINYTYLLVIPVDAMSKSTMVAADAAGALLGSRYAVLAVIGIILATIGANNGFILTGARIYYAMAAEKMFFKPMANINPRYGTPVYSLVGQGIWACILTLTGTFDQLFTYVMFASWIFYAMTAGAVIILRKKYPNTPRHYKTPGYPYTSIVFIIFSVCLVLNTLIGDPRDSLIGAGIIALGLPAYFYWKLKITASSSAVE